MVGKCDSETFGKTFSFGPNDVPMFLVKMTQDWSKTVVTGHCEATKSPWNRSSSVKVGHLRQYE